MTWISLVCLLALSSSAFGRSAYESGYGGYPFHKSEPEMREEVIYDRAYLPSLPSPAPVQSEYGQKKTVDWTPSVQRDIEIESVGPMSSGYGSSYGAEVVPKTYDLPSQGYGARVLPKTYDLPSKGYGVEVVPKTYDLPSKGYGVEVVPKTYDLPSKGYGVEVVPKTYDLPSKGYGARVLPKTYDLPSKGYGPSSEDYGSSARLIEMDPPAARVLSPADILCRGQLAETVIPMENGRKFVVCTTESKGDILECPKSLFYHPQTRRCERKLGPVDDFCASKPCLNGGQCVSTEFSYQCKCAAGFDGKICELDSRVCETQHPCGRSPDARCQSFRWGAALKHICIFEDGAAYGLDAQHVERSPCKGVDGPHALAVTDKGFIMCDGERMFVESCPGRTIWNNSDKACVWASLEEIVVPTRMIQQDPPKLTESYGAEVKIERPEVSSYGSNNYKHQYTGNKY